MTDQPHRLLCVRCREITTGTPEELATLTCCPGCGSLGSPADLDNTVTPTITVHELRILTIWASNWENHMRKEYGSSETRSAIAGICSGLAQFTDAPLSISQEIADLRATFGEVTVVDADGNELESGEQR
jgi:hypothetical protein